MRGTPPPNPILLFVQTFHVILQRGGVLASLGDGKDPVLHLACIIAAVAHDLEVGGAHCISHGQAPGQASMHTLAHSGH